MKYRTFRRRVSDIDSLDRALDRLGKVSWWNDLLSMWSPAGHPSGDSGLRVAIRDGYVSFYRTGQSVAKVRPGTAPVLFVHAKYVSDRESTGRYVQLSHDGRLSSGDEFKGSASIHSWIENAAAYSGGEKNFVDDLLGHNPSAIDLEMALPASAVQPSEKLAAPRMDLVVLETQDDRDTVVFWEAKLLRNGELRSVGQERPPVVGQIENYRAWLEPLERQGEVRNAYIDACQVLAALHERARIVQPNIAALGQDVHRVAMTGMLDIDLLPRLVVCIQEPEAERTSWKQDGHFAKLLEAEIVTQLCRSSDCQSLPLRARSDLLGSMEMHDVQRTHRPG